MIGFLVQGGGVDVAAGVPRAGASGIGNELHPLTLQFGFCSNDSDLLTKARILSATLRKRVGDATNLLSFEK